ncbi:histidine kinase [Streptomyces sp. NPDC008092]|uniref:sensor histidine kinase n=1 Tax=Streptomyces sp. NPDC008092 TaxID=3364808 RepID=UPI0036EFEC7A
MTARKTSVVLLDLVLVAIALADTRAHVDSGDRPAVALALVAAGALTLRRRFPLPAFVLTLPAALVSDAMFAITIALYTLASLSRHRLLLAGCALLFTVADYLAWPPWSSLQSTQLTEANGLLHLTYTLATAAAPVFLGQLVQARRDLSLRLAEISEAREYERLLTTQSVLAKERAQLAREMHDVVSHQVSLIAVQAGALQVAGGDDETRRAAAAIRQLSVQTLDELRHMVSVLRASGSSPTELTPQPSLADLQRLVDTSCIDAKLVTDLPEDLPPTLQRAVYRTVQEALTNVRKHAPGAAAAIHIHLRGGTLRTTVTNTAPAHLPLALPSAHHGLAGLRQRAELLGGTVTSGPTPDGGYELHLDLPTEPR